jgi:hypothetical protein
MNLLSCAMSRICRFQNWKGDAFSRPALGVPKSTTCDTRDRSVAFDNSAR